MDKSFVLDKNHLDDNRVVVYEVNLAIRRAVYEKYKDWLMDHIRDMVVVNKFIKAHVYTQINLDPTNDSFVRTHHLTARYYIKTYEELKKYLEKRAKAMRNQVIEKFEDNYTVSRRVFELQMEIQQ